MKANDSTSIQYNECTSTNDNLNESDDGKPLQIAAVNEETKKFELKLDALNSILLSPEAKDRHVAVVSIAGDFRKGKSFLLNFFLRYLRQNGSSDWLGDKDQPLKGFSWRGGTDRDTTGILMWSKPFVVKRDDEEIAVLLMDTQGAFDSEHTIRDSAVVFALSTLTSSIQVFNLFHNMQEDNLQVLEIFTEYGRMALEESSVQPFQKLLFLIRDWSFPYEFDYGLKGGQGLLNKKLTIHPNQPPQLQRVRRHIRSCFSEIECFLLPYPGSKVATDKDFDGRISMIDDTFITNLQILVPLLLSPANLVVKNIGGMPVTGKQLSEFFKVYNTIFKGDTMPEPKTMLEATAEANNLVAVASAKETYMNAMESTCGGNLPFIKPDILIKKHEQFYEEAMKCFYKIRKMGGKEFSNIYLKKLEDDLKIAFENFQAQNNSKNVINLFGTSFILFIMALSFYFWSKVIELIGLTPLSNLLFLLCISFVILLITYTGCRFGGTVPEFICAVDTLISYFYSFVLNTFFRLIQQFIQQRAIT